MVEVRSGEGSCIINVFVWNVTERKKFGRSHEEERPKRGMERLNDKEQSIEG